MGAVGFGLAAVAVILTAEMKCVELRRGSPAREAVEKIKGENYIGVLMAFPDEEAVLQNSGLFVPNPHLPSVTLSGRKFNIGKIRGVDVIYVMSGEQTVNAGVTVQILVDIFDVVGVVHYSIAGSTNHSLLIGDVSVPNCFAFVSSWTWTEFGSKGGNVPEMHFGAYNLPQKGENLLAEVEFTPVQLFSNGQEMQKVFWIQVDPHWFDIATRLQDVHLQQCLNETNCLPKPPKVTFRLKGSTANILLQNNAYRRFLFNEFNISTVDEESAAVAMTALSNGVPCIVFRGISDMAGGGDKLSSSSLNPLGAVNAFAVAAAFIQLIGKEYQAALKMMPQANTFFLG